MERVINYVQWEELLCRGRHVMEHVEIISYTADKEDDECSKMASISQQMNLFEKENRESRARVNDLEESSKKAAIKRDQEYEDRYVSPRYTN